MTKDQENKLKKEFYEIYLDKDGEFLDIASPLDVAQFWLSKMQEFHLALREKIEGIKEMALKYPIRIRENEKIITVNDYNEGYSKAIHDVLEIFNQEESNEKKRIIEDLTQKLAEARENEDAKRSKELEEELMEVIKR